MTLPSARLSPRFPRLGGVEKEIAWRQVGSGRRVAAVNVREPGDRVSATPRHGWVCRRDGSGRVAHSRGQAGGWSAGTAATSPNGRVSERGVSTTAGGLKEASNSTGRSASERTAPKAATLEVPNPFHQGEGQRRRRRNWAYAVDELPGVSEGDMSRRNGFAKARNHSWVA